MAVMKIILSAMEIAVTVLIVTAVIKKKDSIYGNEPDQKNPMENKRVTFIEDEREKKMLMVLKDIWRL